MLNFDDLWNEFSDKLRNYIYSMVKNDHDTEDILQTVYIKIYNSLDHLENHGAIKTWIYRITKNTIVDFYKKKKPISVSPETLYNIRQELDDSNNMNEEIAKCVGNMLFTLPDKYKDVYDLYANKHLKHREIAETLDISISASKVRLKRAKAMFKEKLYDCCDFEVDIYGNIIDYHSKHQCTNCKGKC